MLATDGVPDDTCLAPSAGSQAAFLKALDNIRRAAIPCNFPLPVGVDIDVANTNVTFSASDGSSKTYVSVGDEAGCVKAPDDGWYFDNETKPTEVILCKGACDVVKADDAGSIDVVFGCPRVVR